MSRTTPASGNRRPGEADATGAAERHLVVTFRTCHLGARPSGTDRADRADLVDSVVAQVHVAVVSDSRARVHSHAQSQPPPRLFDQAQYDAARGQSLRDADDLTGRCNFDRLVIAALATAPDEPRSSRSAAADGHARAWPWNQHGRPRSRPGSRVASRLCAAHRLGGLGVGGDGGADQAAGALEAFMASKTSRAGGAHDGDGFAAAGAAARQQGRRCRRSRR